MIVSILEHYYNDSSVNWLCDLNKCTDSFKKIVENCGLEGKYVGNINVGYQNDDDRLALVHPPTLVEKEVELWFD